MKQPRRRGPSPGFTLIELIFALSLVGIISAFAFPSMAEWVTSTRIDNAARTVAADLRLAVSLAARQGTPVRFRFDEAAQEYTLVDRASNEVLQRREFGPDSELPIGSGTASAATTDVFPNRMTSGPLSITLVAGPDTARVEMTRAGFIQVVGL